MQTPRRYDSAAATANARLSAMLQYILCISRFAHYIKVIGRDRIGSFHTPEEFEMVVQRWLADYCIGNDDAPPETKARYPLREAQVEVRELPGRPGTYACTIHLKPHFQLDDVATTFRLVTELTSPQPAV
jgi:type VI secretion system protein ImpD